MREIALNESLKGWKKIPLETKPRKHNPAATEANNPLLR
jgi:hypothetical protein